MEVKNPRRTLRFCDNTPCYGQDIFRHNNEMYGVFRLCDVFLQLNLINTCTRGVRRGIYDCNKCIFSCWNNFYVYAVKGVNLKKSNNIFLPFLHKVNLLVKQFLLS